MLVDNVMHEEIARSNNGFDCHSRCSSLTGQIWIGFLNVKLVDAFVDALIKCAIGRVTHVLPPRPFDRTPAAPAARSSVRGGGSVRGTVLARPLMTLQSLRHNRCAHLP